MSDSPMTRQKIKVAILGAGHGGLAMAADLKLAGHEVRLAAVPEHSDNLKMVEFFGGVVLEGTTSSGAATGFAKFDLITTDIAKAIDGAQVLMIVIPAFAQESYMRAILPHLAKGQIVVFNPGKFASLVFYKMLRENHRERDVIVGETSSLLYAAKTKGLGHVNLKAVKDHLPFAALPATRTAEALNVLQHLFSQFTPASNVLQTSLDDPGMVVHAISTLLNTSRIEQMGPYKNSHYDITPSVGRVIESVDAERLSVAKTLHIEAYSMLEMMNIMYHVQSASVYEGEYRITAHNVQMAPETLKHRYLTEELPFSLVPLASIARSIDIATPGIDAIIHLGSVCNASDYWKEGRHLESIGLDGMNLNQIAKYVTMGEC